MNRAFKMLVAEDDANDAFLIERAFAKLSPRIPLHFVHDGQEAIDYLAQNHSSAHSIPTMMLVDLKLPRRSGFDVIAWVRGRPGLRRLPIVVLSSSSLAEDVNRAYDFGANSYLVKPSSLSDFEELVRRLEQYWLELNHCPECSNPKTV
jgi:CheY-like chemotaxis protein